MASVAGKVIIKRDDLKVQDLRRDLERHGNRKLIDKLRALYKISSSHRIGCDEAGQTYYIIFSDLTNPKKETMVVYDYRSALIGKADFEVFEGEEVQDKLERDKNSQELK